MSGDRHGKFRAVFLAAVMVLSVVAMSGSAAALQNVGSSGSNVVVDQANDNAQQVNEVNFTVTTSSTGTIETDGLNEIAINVNPFESSSADFDITQAGIDTDFIDVHIEGQGSVPLANVQHQAEGAGTNTDVAAWDGANGISDTDTVLIADLQNNPNVPDGTNISIAVSGVTNPTSGDYDVTIAHADNSDNSLTSTGAVSNAFSTASPGSVSLSTVGSPTNVEVSQGSTSQDVQSIAVDLADNGFHFANHEAAPTFADDNDAIDIAYDLSQLETATSSSNTASDVTQSISIDSVSGASVSDLTEGGTTDGTGGDSNTVSSSVDVTGINSEGDYDSTRNITSFTATYTISGIETLNDNTASGLAYPSGVQLYSGASEDSPFSTTSGPNTDSFDLISPKAATLPGDGSANGDVTTSIETSGSDKAFQAIEAGSAAQSLGLIKVRDNSGGDSPISARTLIDAPSGVTFNATASENLLVTATSGDLSVTNFSIVNNGNRLRIEHSGSSQDGQTVRISGLYVDVANDVSASSSGTRNAFTVDTATTNFDTQLLNAYTPSISLGGAVNIGAGESSKDVSSNVDLSVASPTNGDLSGIIANQSDIVIFANQSNGITFDTSVDPSSLSYSGATGKVNSSGVSISSDQLTIPVTSDFSGGDSLQITSGLKINASEQASSSLLSAETTATSSTGAVAAEQTSTGNNINVQKPEVTFDGGGTLAVGEEGASVSDVVVDSITNGDLTTGDDTDGSTGWVNITTNRSGVTFDKSADYSGSNLVTSTGGNIVDAGDDTAAGPVDFSNDVVVTDDKLAVNIELDGSPGGSDAITLGGIQVNVSDTEVEDGNVNFNATTTPATNKRIPVSATNDGSPSSAPNPATFDKPDLQEAQGSISIGSSGQDFTSTELKVTTTVNGDLTTGDDTTSGSSAGWVNVTTNRTDVTFDKTVTKGNIVTNTDSDIQIKGTSADNIVITDDKLAVPIEGADDGGPSGDENVELGGILLNTSSDIQDGEEAVLNVTTTPEAGKTVTKGATSNTITLTKGSASLSSSQTVGLDNNGQTGVTLNDLTVSSQTGGDLTTGDDQDGATGWVNVSINSSGVTWDTAADYSGNNLVTSTSGDIVDVGDQTAGGAPDFTDDVVVTEDTLSVNIEADGDTTTNADDSITLGDALINVSESVADNSTYGLTVTTTPNSQGEVTSDVSETITVQTAQPDGIGVAAGTPAPSTQGGSDTTVTVTSSSLSSTDTGTNFGGADVELSLQSQPDNADKSIGDVVNQTKLTTANDGTVDYNFSTDTAGTYVIDHNASGQVNTTQTYNVDSGNIDGVNISGVENALRGGASGQDDNLRTGVYRVNVTDSSGNLANTDEDFQFRVLVGGQTSELIGLSDDLADDGTGSSANQFVAPTGADNGNIPFDNDVGDNKVFAYNPSDDTTTKGSFYVYVGNDLAEDIDVEIIPRAGFTDIEPNTGTTTFFGTVDNVNLDANETVNLGENTNVTATATTSGETVAVPRLSQSFSSDNSSVFSVVSSSGTTTAGEATANISAAGVGSANLTATIQSTDATQEISVVNQTANFNVSNVAPDGATVEQGNNISTVSADIENNGQVSGTQDIEFRIDTTGDGQLDTLLDTNSSFSVDAGETRQVTFSNIPTDSLSAGTYTHGVVSDDDTATASITISEPANASASVTFDDQTVTNGSETVNVANANYTLADGTAGDYVVVAHVVNDDGSTSSPVGYSSNVSGDTDDITVDLNASEAQGDDLDTLTANTTLQAMLHNTSADSAYGSALTIGGVQVTDNADITVEEDAPAYYTLKFSNSIADRAVKTTIISTFSTYRQSGSTALLPRSVYRYTRTHTGGLR